MRLSVIIPTFNRKDVLLHTLDCLMAQTGDPEMEIIVVDDGSQDGTAEAVRAHTTQAPYPVNILVQNNRGPAAARNLALNVAQGELVLFLGDDIFAAPDLVKTHLDWHAQRPEANVAILGYTTFAPGMRQTALSEYIERAGVQFAYARIQDYSNVSYLYFYTSNVSLKRAFLLRGGMFDEEFRYAAYEDIELAYRLQSQHGLHIIFEPRARAYHFHPVSLRQMQQRAHAKGRSVVLLHRKHPEVFDVDNVVRLFPAHKVFLKRVAFIVLIPLAELIERLGWQVRLDRVYAWIETFYFYQGIRAAQMEK